MAVAALIAVSAAGVGALSAPAAAVRESYPAFDLLATQAAITMNGTFTPDVTPQFQAAVLDAYILPLVGPGYSGVALRTPQDLWPLSGITALTYNNSTRVGYGILKDKYEQIVGQNTADGQPNTPMVVFGYSQSAFISSMFDEHLADVRVGGGAVPPTTFVQVGNTNIPNGGLMSRFNGLGLTPWTPLVFAPTKTGNITYEVLRQYDPFADFPKYPLNVLSAVNALMGYLLHFTLPVSGSAPWLKPVIDVLNFLITPISLNPDSPNYVKAVESRYEDTIYQFVPTARLPILSPLYAVGLTRLANALDSVLRPVIEAGYDRSASFGVPTPAQFGLGPDFASALQQSWQAFTELLNPVQTASVAAAAPPAALPSAVSATAEQSLAAVSAAPMKAARSAVRMKASPRPKNGSAAVAPVAVDPPALTSGESAPAVPDPPAAADIIDARPTTADSGSTATPLQSRRSATAARGSVPDPGGKRASRAGHATR